MKTTKIMIRDMGFGSVRQNHKTGEVCLTDILQAGNAKRLSDGREPRRFDRFFELDDTKEYLEKMADLHDIGELQLYGTGIMALGATITQGDNTVMPACKPTDFYRSKRGRSGGTWGHPYLAIKLAAYLDKEFEIRMHAAMHDGLLAARDAGGDSYKTMCAAIDAAFGIGRDPVVYASIAKRIQISILGKWEQGGWDAASNKQLEQRDRMHTAIESGAKWAGKAGASVDEFIQSVID